MLQNCYKKKGIGVGVAIKPDSDYVIIGYDPKENIASNHTSRGRSQLGNERVSLFQWRRSD